MISWSGIYMFISLFKGYLWSWQQLLLFYSHLLEFENFCA